VVARGTGHWLWQIPLTVLACVAGSLVIVWAVSTVAGFTMNPSLVAVLSAVASAVAIAVEVRGKGTSPGSPVA
jgi:hypothetical protein